MDNFKGSNLDSILKGGKVIGLNQTFRGIEKKQIGLVVLALDADPDFKDRVESKCREENVKIINVSSSIILAEFCKIDVPCAVVGMLKNFFKNGEN